MINPTTRRYPRTMTEAFGPYHHLAPLQVEYLPMHKHDKIILWSCVVALLCLSMVIYVS